MYYKFNLFNILTSVMYCTYVVILVLLQILFVFCMMLQWNVFLYIYFLNDLFCHAFL